MNKLKEGLASVWGYITLIVGAAIGALFYILNLKSKELGAAKAKIALANTQKEADVIEAEINQKLAEKELTKREQEDLNKALDLLTEKRQNLKQEGNFTDSQVEDYWNKK
jgi:hypothetical protein